MSRPVGSRNKPKITQNKNSIYLTNLEKQIENTPITRTSSMGWRKWGVDNLYCNKLLDLYAESPTHAACINFGVQSIVGEGVDYEASNFNGKEVVPNAYEDWNSLIRKISLDFMLYGSYAVQCILNKDGKTLSYYHIPLDKVRWGEYDEDGQIVEYYISADWSALGQNPPIRIDAFDMRPDTKIEKGKGYLYVYRPYSPLVTYYQQPHYSAGISAIQSEIEFVRHDLKSAVNGFIPSGMLILNEVETDEERRGIIDNVNKMFVGTENSNSLLISFRSNVEEQAPSFVPFAANTGNVNIYADANQRCINRILGSHQICDAQLIGLPLQGASGFNSEGAILETAYNVYNKVVGNYNRQCVIQTFNFMLALNGVDTEIVMKPIKFTLEDSTSTDITKDNAEVDDKDLTEDKIEEKKDGNDVKE